MKKAITLFLALTLFVGVLSSPVMAQEEKPERGTLRFTEIIAPQFDEVRQFVDNGLAAAKKDGKWGYIDTTGAAVIPFVYNYAYSFSEGKAVVSLGESRTEEDWQGEEITEWPVGLIDEKGNYTQLTYSYGWPTAEYFPLYVPQWRLDEYDKRDNFLWNGYVSINAMLFDAQGECIMTNDHGNDYWQVTEGLVGSEDLDYFYFNPAIIKETGDYGLGTGGLVRFLDAYGSMEVGSIVCRGIRPFNQGLAPTKRAKITAIDENTGCVFSDGLWGFMNRNFEYVIEPQFEDFWVNGISGNYTVFGVTGLASVKKDGKWGAIDKNGKTVIPFEYELLQSVSDGLICFEKNGKYGYLDAETYQVVIPAQFAAASSFENGLSPVYDGTNAFLIDKNGEKVPGSDALDVRTYFPYLLDESMDSLRRTVDEYPVIERNGKYGFGHIEYAQPLPTVAEMDDWAYNEVTAAIEAELVPSSLQNLYRRNITRKEFCDLTVELLKAVEGKTLEELVLEKTGKPISVWQQEYPFTDAADRSVIAASALGIINGRGNNVFDPYSSINRQEAAAMLMRTAKVVGLEPGEAVSFNDTASLQAWALDGINFVSGLIDPTTGKKVMGGTGNNEFSPDATYTREQAYLTILRLRNNAEG